MNAGLVAGVIGALIGVTGGAIGSDRSDRGSDWKLQLYCVPEAHLRIADAEPQHPILPVQSQETSLSSGREEKSARFARQFPEPMSLNMDPNDRDFQLHRRLKDDFDSIRQKQSPDDGFARCVDSLFRPEVLHIGKTYISCSLLTAIKRKNPLCLINPIFLTISW
jgi:hypothetical protein